MTCLSNNSFKRPVVVVVEGRMKNVWEGGGVVRGS